MRKVLIVDDSALNRTIMQAVLANLPDVMFYQAEDGIIAMNILAEHDIDLVILDLIMPNKDGYQVLAEMKAKKRLRSIPVIVCSSVEHIESISKALESGAYDYFHKPLKQEEMQVIIPMKAQNALQTYAQQKKIKELNRTMKLDRLLANVFQQSLMAETKEFSNINMYGKYLAYPEIGGSLYDCIQHEQSFWFIISAVAEYGVSAAMLSSMIKMEFKHCVQKYASPEIVLKNMNNIFYNMTQGAHEFTAFVGLIEGKTLTYANGGHSYPLLFTKNSKEAVVLHHEGDVLGLTEGETYNKGTALVNSGDIIFSYTIGLLEKQTETNEDTVYDELCKFFLTHESLIQDNPSGFFEVMCDSFGHVYDKTFKDDVALMLLCIK